MALFFRDSFVNIILVKISTFFQMVMGVFGQTKKDPKERVRELKKKMRHESNGIRRQMNRMQMEEEKVCFFNKSEFQ